MRLALNRNERLALRCIGGGNFTVRTLAREMALNGASIAEPGLRQLLSRLREAGLVEASIYASKSIPRDYWLAPKGLHELTIMEGGHCER